MTRNGPAVRFMERLEEYRRALPGGKYDFGEWYVVVCKIASIEGREAWDSKHGLGLDGKAHS